MKTVGRLPTTPLRQYRLHIDSTTELRAVRLTLPMKRHHLHGTGYLITM